MLRRPGVKAAAWLFLAATGACRATDIQLSYAVLERLIARQVFAEDGRKYVKGGKDDKCSFAYLENPKIAAAGGQVAVKARFTGRSALDMFGKCVGLGDAFDLTVFGTPFYDKGRVAFRNISVQTDRDSFYIRKVRQALMQSVGKQFEYNILNDAKKLMEGPPDAGAPYKREMLKFDVSDIKATDSALVLTVDFVLAVK